MRLRARLTGEDFRSHTPAREFVPLTVTQGCRTVVTAHFYTADPALMPTELHPPRVGEGDAYFYRMLHRLGQAHSVLDGLLRLAWNPSRPEGLLRESGGRLSNEAFCTRRDGLSALATGSS